MKKIVILFLILGGSGVKAQTPINKTIACSQGQKINMHFDYPNLVRISTWDKNEISITGSVSINSGESDNAFELKTSVSNNTIMIRNEINNMKNLPHRITVIHDGQKTVFKSQGDYEKYASQNGRDYNVKTSGVDMDILIDIKVPRNMETAVEAVYGIVEVKDFAGPLRVDATYGGVDASLTEKTTGELIAETNYGQIYTNLELKFSGSGIQERDFHTSVAVKPGSGPRYSFESKYGNVYLRKSAAN